jgi:hypothetical protein
MWSDALHKLDVDSLATFSVGFDFPLGDWEAEFKRNMYSDFSGTYFAIANLKPRMKNIERTIEEIDKKLAARRAGE